MHWLSAGKQPNGMVIRMQGFDRGLFGGNFHTHNWLPLLPGVDVVATSTGRDYARAMRHAVRQARAGRVVMMVDATYLLNLRHLHGRDEAWLTSYPGEGDELAFDAVLERRDDSDAVRQSSLRHVGHWRRRGASGAEATRRQCCVRRLRAAVPDVVGGGSRDRPRSVRRGRLRRPVQAEPVPAHAGRVGTAGDGRASTTMAPRGGPADLQPARPRPHIFIG